jgi:membrane protease YdiL (CAAX protease family)
MRFSPRGCFVSGIAILLVYNVARGIGLFGSFGDASAIGLLGAFIALAFMAGLTAIDLGLARVDTRRGAAYGIASSLISVVLLVIGSQIASDFFKDSRGDMSGPRILLEIALPIFLLTVLPEEFAFRGVLLASGRELWGDRRATFITSVLFGLWHISPTLGTMSQNRQLDNALGTMGGTIVLVAGSVLATFVAGLIFSWLRLRSRSLLAPVIAHLSTNGVALVLAWIAIN